jgi:hypothetical protein
MGDIQVILYLRVRAHIQKQASAGGTRIKHGSEHADDLLVPLAAVYSAGGADGYVVLKVERV